MDHVVQFSAEYSGATLFVEPCLLLPCAFPVDGDSRRVVDRLDVGLCCWLGRDRGLCRWFRLGRNRRFCYRLGIGHGRRLCRRIDNLRVSAVLIVIVVLVVYFCLNGRGFILRTGKNGRQQNTERHKSAQPSFHFSTPRIQFLFIRQPKKGIGFKVFQNNILFPIRQRKTSLRYPYLPKHYLITIWRFVRWIFPIVSVLHDSQAYC